MRGKEAIQRNVLFSIRITPAYAGKSTHLCGNAGRQRGSPPPMRGKVFLAPLVLSVIRITPAYAGKSAFLARNSYMYQDHPRLCGEKRNGVYNINTGKGSPPPMRGKVRHCRFSSMLDRITPAYAGKSCASHFVKCSRRDHPRLCGEKQQQQDIVRWIPGSPPPMRGKVAISGNCKDLTRITPAYAGKSRTSN